MSSAQNRKEFTSRFSARTTLLTGLLIGVVSGVVVYSIIVWTIRSSNSGMGSSSYSTESTDTQRLANSFDTIFSDELSQSDFFGLTESLSTLTQHDLKKLIKKSSNLPWNTRLYTLQEMLVEFLVHISPKEALASLVDFDEHRRLVLLRVVFACWSKTNLEQALSAATELPQSEQHSVLRAIFTEQNSLSSEDLLSISSKHNLESELIAWHRELETFEVLDQEPAKALDLLANDEIDDFLQMDLYRQIVDKWYQLDGMNIIPQIGNARLRESLWSELFDFVTGRDRVVALDYLFGDSERISRPGLAQHLINYWVKDNAEEAFQAVQDLPNSQFRNSMMQRLVFDWAETDPNAVLERLMDIPRFYRSSVLSAAAAELAQDNPKDVLDRISSFRSLPGTNIGSATRTIIRNWSDDEPTQSLEWVQTNTIKGSTLRNDLLSEVLGEYALEEPEQAMKIAVQEFISAEVYPNLESSVIRSLLFANRLDTAKELLGQVRGENRVSQTIEVGVEFAKKSQIDEVITLSSSIPEERNSDYFYQLVTRLTIYDRVSEIMEVISKIPNTEVQSDVAEQLLSAGYGDSTFTTEQVETLRSYVSE
ncbi:MAG: hypothetical protein F4227_00240 [Gammaproteobacteria bacterium]|nr:hypothetical protein [Gammaproteobacteria bacterium]MYF01443.1 hypothetical protein [Gammaproteobacteria bacterium]MYI77621.1 hypothetical protein [Gammaproteobacteria bacterium]